MKMLKRRLGFVIVLVWIYCPILINSIEDFNEADFETLGSIMAANDNLIISVQDRAAITFSAVYNYASSSPQYCTLSYPVTNNTGMYVTMIAMAKTVQPNNAFVFVVHSILNQTTYMLIASITFSPCALNILKSTYMFNSTYPPYSVLKVNSIGTVVIYLDDTNAFVQSLTSYASGAYAPFIRSSSINFLIPAALELQDNWGVLAFFYRQTLASSKYRPAIYYMNISSCLTSYNATCFTFPSTYTTLTYGSSWQAQVAPPNDALDDNYYALYSMALSISGNNGLLIGVQFMNTVFQYTISSTSFTYINRRCPETIVSTGFGKAVGWLDNTTIAVLANNFTIDYIQWHSSTIELYPIGPPSSFSNAISPYASYPNSRQEIWSKLNGHLINMLAVSGSGCLIYMDYYSKVHVIRPSGAGFYVNTEDGFTSTNNTIAIAPNIRCSSGTIKNITAYGKDIFRCCLLCPEGTFYAGNSSNSSNVCTVCNTTMYFCPWGAVTALPISVLDIYSQAQVYPQSPESDNFEDILLVNMFNMDFSSNCLVNVPLLYALIIMGAGCAFLLFMGILKLTRKCRKPRRMMKKIFKQTDLIGEGELWIGGVTSFTVLVLAIFAFRFSSGFMKQYPIETAGDATFTCDSTLRNAKFSTSMQSLGTPVLDSDQPIFDMLDEQLFKLSVTFLNADYDENELNVSQILGSISLELPKETSRTKGILQGSVNLTSHMSTIVFNVSNEGAAGGFRIGLYGPPVSNGNFDVQELNFSYAFYHTNRTLTQDPLITIQLIKLINITEALSNNGDTVYSALWIPTFIKNDDQLFYSNSDFQSYHVLKNTVLTVQITEATYYILNQQEPITKLTEIIFTNILFTTMCIELFALTFLFYKLALGPVAKATLSLCFKPKPKITPRSDSGHGCPHCRSVDADTLPANRMPIQRAAGDMPMHPIRRQVPDVYEAPESSISPDLFY